jgi:hypothetical protein
LIAGDLDIAVFPGQLNADIVQRALATPGIRLMNVTQAGAIAKTIPGFKRRRVGARSRQLEPRRPRC